MAELNNPGPDLSPGEEIDGFKLYRYRWLIIFLYCLSASVNFGQYLQYTIITNVIAEYYDIGPFMVSWTSLICMISYVALFIPASYILNIIDLRKISILISFLTTAGTIIKIFSTSPDKFYVVLIGQGFCAVAQVFILSLPSKIAAVWFGKDEVSTACAIAVVGTNLGTALGCVLSPNLINKHGNVADDLFYLSSYTAFISFIVFLLVIFWFKPKPKTVPSQAQARALEKRKDFSYIQSLGRLIKNRDYLRLLLAMGVSNGLWNAMGIFLNIFYLHYFPDREEDVGLLALIAILAGSCVGGFIFGYILDKTHRFKLITFSNLILAAGGYLAISFMLELQNRAAVFTSVTLYGFFLSGSLTVSYEYAVEVTYPEPETTTLAAMNATILFFGMVFSVVVDKLYKTTGFFWGHVTLAGLTALSSISVLFISPKLRRLEDNSSTHNDTQLDRYDL